MDKKKLQEEIFKNASALITFDFATELHDVFIGEYAMTDFICNPGCIKIAKEYSSNEDLVETLIKAAIMIGSKKYKNSIYTMNFITLVPVDCFGFKSAIIMDDYSVVFFKCNMLQYTYNISNCAVPYITFIMNGEKIIIFSESSKIGECVDFPISCEWICNVYEKNVSVYCDMVSSYVKTIFDSYYHDYDLKDYLEKTIPLCEGVRYPISYILDLLQCGIDKFFKQCIHPFKEKIREYEGKKKVNKVKRDRMKREQYEYLERIESEYRLTKITKEIYGKIYYRLSDIPLKTRYTIDMNMRNKNLLYALKRSQNKERYDRARKKSIESAGGMQIPSKYEELYKEFPNVKNLEMLKSIYTNRKTMGIPKTLESAIGSIDILSEKTNDNFTKFPNIFTVTLGIVYWISDAEILNLINKKDIVDILSKYSYTKKKYRFFRKYLQENLLYLSDARVINGEIILLFGMKGDNCEI